MAVHVVEDVAEFAALVESDKGRFLSVGCATGRLHCAWASAAEFGISADFTDCQGCEIVRLTDE
ncbi:MAG: hypothetical protein V2I33_16510 [Kangiellaceae bacterium]|nr:hypothetical protein [Kangiellaceae bacterium]